MITIEPRAVDNILEVIPAFIHQLEWRREINLDLIKTAWCSLVHGSMSNLTYFSDGDDNRILADVLEMNQGKPPN
jgi:hypothetical protein